MPRRANEKARSAARRIGPGKIQKDRRAVCHPGGGREKSSCASSRTSATAHASLIVSALGLMVGMSCIAITCAEIPDWGYLAASRELPPPALLPGRYAGG